MINNIEMSRIGKYTRKDLEALAEIGILPSTLGVGEEYDTSAQFLEKGVDIDDEGIIMIYDKEGGDEFPHRINNN